MKTYGYRAKFDRLDRTADGTVEAHSENEASEIVYGMCGEWYESDADPRWSFTAGCPDSVTVEELAE